MKSKDVKFDETKKLFDKIAAALSFIDPNTDYDKGWLTVGMALHSADMPISIWENWSRKGSKYKEGCCEEHWKTFTKGRGIDIDSLFWIAQNNGWDEPEWFSTYSGKARTTFSSAAAPHPEPEQQERRWNRKAQALTPYPENPQCSFTDYFEAVFGADGNAFVIKGEKTEKGKPKVNRTVLQKNRPVLSSRILSAPEIAKRIEDGTLKEETGVYVLVNPVKDYEHFKSSASESGYRTFKSEDVSSFRNVLIEADEQSLTEQWQLIMDELQLPVAAVTYSGGKSLHAIVRIGAESQEQHKERTEKLYSICKLAGLIPDSACKDPSRATRLPEAFRGEVKQKLLYVNKNPQNWDEWLRWADEQMAEKKYTMPELRTDEKEELFDIDDLFDKELPERNWIIGDDENGFLSEGLCMLTAPPKTGKSFMTLQMADSISQGKEFLGYPCKEGAVLLYSLEDGEGLIKKRIRKMKLSKNQKKNFLYKIETKNRLSKGLEEQILDYLNDGLLENLRMIVIDTYQKVKPQKPKNQEEYDFVYQILSPIRSLALKYHFSIVLVHHNAKLTTHTDDVFDLIHGSTALAGVCDQMIVMTGARTEKNKTMSFIGKEVISDEIIVCQEEGIWKNLGKKKILEEEEVKKSLSEKRQWFEKSNFFLFVKNELEKIEKESKREVNLFSSFLIDKQELYKYIDEDFGFIAKTKSKFLEETVGYFAENGIISRSRSRNSNGDNIKSWEFRKKEK